MKLWRRVLAGLFGVEVPRRDSSGIPWHIIDEIDHGPGDKLLTYGEVVFLKKAGEDKYTYMAGAGEELADELTARGPMTDEETKRFFVMRRIVDLAGDI